MGQSARLVSQWRELLEEIKRDDLNPGLARPDIEDRLPWLVANDIMCIQASDVRGWVVDGR